VRPGTGRGVIPVLVVDGLDHHIAGNRINQLRLEYFGEQHCQLGLYSLHVLFSDSLKYISVSPKSTLLHYTQETLAPRICIHQGKKKTRHGGKNGRVKSFSLWRG